MRVGWFVFTGIVQGVFPVAELKREPGLLRLAVKLPDAMLEGLERGASVALNGVCMTVTSIDASGVHFDAMQETMLTTTLGSLQPGEGVNVERSARMNAEIGGHIVSGHIDATAEIIAVDEAANNRFVTYQLPLALGKYVLQKGFIAVDGCSLTVAGVDQGRAQFTVAFIPETLRATRHSERGVGDRVNIEVDRQTQAIVDTVERVLGLRDSAE